MASLRQRQIHLDFHTSELIPGIGAEFNGAEFARTLKAASVNSVTCFSRCHHGWIYHETKFPNRHPHLTCNLLAEQIRACHAEGIRVPIYITVGWDHLAATEHPEWVERDADGRTAGRTPLGTGGWFNLCFASPYVDYVIAQTEEVLDLFGDEVDGFFFDILFQQGVHGVYALQEFERLGWDPADPVAVERMRHHLVDTCIQRIGDAVRAKNPNCGLFFNSGHVGPKFRPRLPHFSHLEIESLPTGGWGYMHFPMTVRYARTLGLPYMGMTGKFSEMWGHFNSYKNPAALEFECFSMLAGGAACSVGDQLPPGGRLDAATYRLIGGVYAQVAEREPWCEGAVSVSEIAVLNAEAYATTAERMDPRNLGATRVLMEGRHQFDFVDFEADLAGYSVLILPDDVLVAGAFAERVKAFLAGGGAMILSGTSGVGLPDLPAAHGGDLPFSPDFLRPAEELGLESDTDFVMYERGVELRPASEATVLATLREPYFNRTWKTFCSHAHTPPAGPSAAPGIVQRGRVVQFAHPVFTTYARHSMRFHRDLVLAVLERLLPEPLLRVGGPSSLQATLTRQGEREVVHLLHYVPERRGLHFDIVEDRLPVYGVPVSVRTSATRATLQPQGEPLAAERVGERLSFTVPVVDGHQMVVLEG